ncbi:nadh dehydrogenase [Nannochloropsis oceanica]
MASTRFLSRRGLSGVAAGQLEKGFKDFGPGGRSSVAGITASLFGGTGFLGKYLQFEMGKVGYRLYLANRGDEQDVRPFKVAFDLGQWASIPYSIRDEDSIKRVLEGSDVAINCIGKYYDTKHMIPYHRNRGGKLSNVNFPLEEIHIEAPARLAEVAKSVGVEHFLHVSALGADPESNVRWLATKGKGEEALKSVFPTATIVRPGRLFGPEEPAPELVTYQKPEIVDLPLAVGEVASLALEQLPNPVLTVDDAKLMSTDVILEPSSKAMTFKDLDIKPTPLEKVAFNYLYRYRTDGGHFPYAEGYH